MTTTNNKRFAATLNTKACHSKALKTYKKYQSLVKKGQCRLKKTHCSEALLLTLTAHLTPGAWKPDGSDTGYKFKNYMLDKHFVGSLKAEPQHPCGQSTLVRDQANLVSGAALCASLTFFKPGAYINKTGCALSYAIANAVKNQPCFQWHSWQQSKQPFSGAHHMIYGTLLLRHHQEPLYISTDELKQARVVSLEYQCHPYITAAKLIRCLCRQALVARRVVSLTPRLSKIYIKN